MEVKCYLLLNLKLPIASFLQLLILDDLDPVVIRVQNKGHILHPAIGQPLLPVHLFILHELACLVKVIDTDADVSKSLRFIVAVVVDFAFLCLCAVVPGQLQQPFLLSQRVDSVRGIFWLGNGKVAGVSEEVQCELGLLLLRSTEESHTHDILVEFQTLLRVLDADHAVVKSVCRSVGRGDVLCLVNVLLPDYLDPVPVGVKGKRDTPHAPIREFFLEFVARILDPLARGLEIVHAHTNVSKPLVWVFVAVVDGKVGVALRTIVVGELEDTFTVSPVAAWRG